MHVKVCSGRQVLRDRDLPGENVSQQDPHITIVRFGEGRLRQPVYRCAVHGVIFSLSPAPKAYPRLTV